MKFTAESTHPGWTQVPRKPSHPGSLLTKGRIPSPANTALSLHQRGSCFNGIPPGEEDRSQVPSNAIPRMFKT